MKYGARHAIRRRPDVEPDAEASRPACTLLLFGVARVSERVQSDRRGTESKDHVHVWATPPVKLRADKRAFRLRAASLHVSSLNVPRERREQRAGNQ